MGRVRNRGPILDGTEPVEGVDTKDKLFFEKPILTLVGKAEAYVSSFPNNSGTSSVIKMEDNPHALISKCRLATSRQYQICNSPPKEVTYALGQLPTAAQVTEYLHDKRIHGYGTGAVVTRRYQQDWRYRSVAQWGVIVHEIAYPQPTTLWSPYSVIWFEAHNGLSTEKAWAEDLVVIHAHVSDDLLDDILVSQNINLRLRGRASPV